MATTFDYGGKKYIGERYAFTNTSISRDELRIRSLPTDFANPGDVASETGQSVP